MNKILALILAAVFLFASSPANAAVTAFLTLGGQKQGKIEGGVTQRGHEKSIIVTSIDQHAAVPVDNATGGVRGPATQGTFTITKEIDRSSPLLRKAMGTNEVLTTFDLKFYAPGPSGTESYVYNIQLRNARIVAVRFRMDANKNPDATKREIYEDVTFVFEQITWTWLENNTVAYSDSWTSPGH